MAGSAMPTTVASRAAMPEPSTVAVTTHRPAGVDSRSPAGPPVACAATLTTFLLLKHADGAGGTHRSPFGSFIKEQNYSERTVAGVSPAPPGTAPKDADYFADRVL